jgi:hypothetical protein
MFKSSEMKQDLAMGLSAPFLGALSTVWVLVVYAEQWCYQSTRRVIVYGGLSVNVADAAITGRMLNTHVL